MSSSTLPLRTREISALLTSSGQIIGATARAFLTDRTINAAYGETSSLNDHASATEASSTQSVTAAILDEFADRYASAKGHVVFVPITLPLVHRGGGRREIVADGH